jgi:hypothetical protein
MLKSSPPWANGITPTFLWVIGSTDWAQAMMEEIFQDVLDEVELYIDGIGLFHTKWKDHLAMIDLVLTCLEENSFTVIPLNGE